MFYVIYPIFGNSLEIIDILEFIRNEAAASFISEAAHLLEILEIFGNIFNIFGNIFNILDFF